MRINGAFGCDLEIKQIKKFGDDNVRLAKAVLRTHIDEDMAAERFGEDFKRVAFAGFRVIDGVPQHACGTITKPRLVCEAHELNIAGHTVRVMPDVPKIETIEGSPAVVVTLVVPIECGDGASNMIGDIAVCCGDIVRTTWTPMQVGLPLVQKDKRGAFGTAQPRLV